MEECVQLGLTLTAALSQLHQQGLVHRDIKPSNIIFVNGTPKLADIGLMARVSDPRSFVGTAGFIPPEGPGTSQADLYSLGKVLYEISTGKDRQDFPELPAELIYDRISELQRLGERSGGKVRDGRREDRPSSNSLLELNSILVKA